MGGRVDPIIVSFANYQIVPAFPLNELSTKEDSRLDRADPTGAQDMSESNAPADSLKLASQRPGFNWVHWPLIAQTTPTLVLSTVGFVLTGLIIDVIQHWQVFTKITELFILVSVLLNLKGNLEMGMATRLSTAANKKNAENVALEDFELPASGDEHDEVFGNICLVQYQAITSGLFVGILSCVLGGLVHKTVNSWSEIMLILASSTMTSFISSLLTGGLLSFIIVRSRRAHINPDNISTPLANCFGDLSTIIVLAWLSRMLFSINSTFLSTSLLVGSIGLGCVWVVLTLRNKTVRPLFWSCWPPVIYSILIASVAGLAFERFIGRFEGLGLVLTVANGICGNAGSILAARHTTSLQLEMANDKKKNRAARCSLFLLCTPIHFVYLASIQACHLGHASNTWSYIIVNMLASHFQLFGILWVAPRLVKAIWQRGLDPDNYTMPLLAAINDLVGTLIFIGAFSILALMNK